MAEQLEKIIATTTVEANDSMSALYTRLEFPSLLTYHEVTYQFLDVSTTIRNREGITRTCISTMGATKKLVSESQDSATEALRKHAAVLNELTTCYESQERAEY